MKEKILPWLMLLISILAGAYAFGQKEVTKTELGQAKLEVNQRIVDAVNPVRADVGRHDKEISELRQCQTSIMGQLGGISGDVKSVNAKLELLISERRGR